MNVLRMRDLTKKVRLGESTIFKKIANGTFPKPFKIAGSRAVGWLESDIDAWLVSQTRDVEHA